MDQPDLTLSPEAHSAWLIRGVIETTAQPNETADDVRTRAAAIIETFKTFAPDDAVEAMIVCHCISLRFVLQAAMRDAGNVDLEPKLLIRTRASAMSISKTLHQWLSKLESMKSRNEARAAEAQRNAEPVRAKQPQPAATAKAKPPAPPERDAPASNPPLGRPPERPDTPPRVPGLGGTPPNSNGAMPAAPRTG